MNLKRISSFFVFSALALGVVAYTPFRTSNLTSNVQAQVADNTYTPTEIPLSDPEILNHQRGYYRWKVDATFFDSGEVVPVKDGVNHDNTSFDSYERLTWDDLEVNTVPTGQDASDPNFIDTARYQPAFDLIDSYAQNAKDRGGVFNFSIYTFCPDCSSNSGSPSILVPSYISDDTATYNGWIRNFTAASNYAYVPDWNDEDFLVRVEKLLKALGNRYNDDNRIGTIDIRVFGNWGEWHTFCIYPEPTFPSYCQVSSQNPPTPPNSQETMTLANKQRLIDMHIDAFVKKRLVVLVDKDAVGYTANKTTDVGKIGWRGDCLGLHNGTTQGSDVVDADEHFTRVDGRIYSGDLDGDSEWATLWNAEFKDRWMYAPVWSEFCLYNPNRWSGQPNVSGSKHTAQAAADQILEFHVSSVGNGNFQQSGTNAQKWATIPNTGSFNFQRDTLMSMTRRSGYRYEIDQLTLPSLIYKDQGFSISTKWKNVGNAPIYENWDVWIRLRNTSTNEIWQVKSGVNLKNILSTEVGTTDVVDAATVTNTVPDGTYELSVIVKEPDSVNISFPNYRTPLYLGIQGRQGDGSYVLDNTQTVQIATFIPTSTPTSTSTLTPTTAASVTPTSTESTITPTGTPIPSAYLELTVQNNTKFNTTKPKLTGKSAPNAKVKVTVYSAPQSGIVTADANGNWNFIPPVALSIGEHRYEAQLVNADGSLGQIVGPRYFSIAPGATELADTGSSLKGILVVGIVILSGSAGIVLLNRRSKYISLRKR